MSNPSIQNASSRQPQLDPSSSKLPWNDQQLEQVRSLRKAISTREDSDRIDRDVAPLMSELLARVDAILSPPPVNPTPAPPAPNPSNPPSAQQLFSAVTTARGKLADTIQSSGDESTRQRLVGMLRVVDAHVAMRREIMMRVQDADRR